MEVGVEMNAKIFLKIDPLCAAIRVTRFGKIYPLWPNIKSILQIFVGLFDI